MLARLLLLALAVVEGRPLHCLLAHHVRVHLGRVAAALLEQQRVLARPLQRLLLGLGLGLRVRLANPNPNPNPNPDPNPGPNQARGGECTRNPGFMLGECRQSCGACTEYKVRLGAPET